MGAKKNGPSCKSGNLVLTLPVFHSLDDPEQVTISSAGLRLFICKMGILILLLNNHLLCNPGAE